MTTKVQKWGNSLAIRIPKEMAEQLSIQQGTEINITVNDQEMKITPKSKKPTLDELLSKITSENRHEEIDFGKPQGKELI